VFFHELGAVFQDVGDSDFVELGGSFDDAVGFAESSFGGKPPHGLWGRPEKDEAQEGRNVDGVQKGLPISKQIGVYSEEYLAQRVY